jgi:Tfp pilus assembly protein PilN
VSIHTEARHGAGTLTALAALPKVNLLPPEIAESRRVRRIQLGLGGAVLAAVGVVVLLYVVAVGGVSSAQQELDTATARQSALQVQTAKYREVTAVYAKAAAAQGMLTQAMGQEVRYSLLLNDLSLSIPDNVWIKQLTFDQSGVTAGGGVGQAGIGKLSVTGVAFSHDDVAVWLESLATQQHYADPSFTNSTEALLGTRKIVNFTSTATLTAAAYSGRSARTGG